MTRRVAAAAVALVVALAVCDAISAVGLPRDALAATSSGSSTHPAAATSRAPAARHATPAPPPLGVRAAALIEESSGDQLYGLNSSAQLAIASTTKLMTALVTLRHTPLSRVFADPDYVPASEDSQIHLEPGERMNVRDLLTAMLLPSADDAAVDLAYNVGHGSVSRFLGMMNAEAHRLGLTHTHYTTPSGLDTPGNYSSATDLVILASYLLQHEPFFKHTVAQTHAVLRTGNHVRFVTNLNDLVARFPWINGVKTGHTLDAGYVLVASGTQNGMTLIDAVLGTSSEAARDSGALALLEWGFANFGMRTPVHAGAVLARPAITGGKPGVHARLVDRLVVHARVPEVREGQASRNCAGAAHRPGREGRARRLGGGGRGRPGRDADSAAAGRRPPADQEAEIHLECDGRIGYPVRTSGGSGCRDRPDNVLARMDEGNEGRQA